MCNDGARRRPWSVLGAGLAEAHRAAFRLRGAGGAERS
jgi:hypothetical protein